MKLPCLKLFLAAFIWGGALVAGRVISGSLPPFTITFLRFSLVSIFLLPVLYVKNGSFPVPSTRAVLLICAVSISGIVLFNYCMFTALRTITAVRSSVFIAFTPVVVAFVSGLFFKERITGCMKIGFLLALSGAVITVTNGDIIAGFRAPPAVGDLFLLGCVVSWTVYSLTTKYTLRFLSPLAVLTYASVLGTVLLIPLALGEGALNRLSALPPVAWISLLYLSFGAAGISYLWYFEGIQALGASKAAIFLNLEPVAAILLGIVILGEVLTGSVALGAVLVLGGLFLTSINRHPVFNS